MLIKKWIMVENWPMEKHQSQTYLQMYSTKYSRNGASRSYKKKKIIWEEKKQDCSPTLFWEMSVTLTSKPDKDIGQ